MSALRATSSTCRVSMTSVTTGRVLAARADSRKPSASAPSPLKEYGDVLGLNAPPRSITAPRLLTRLATLTIISTLSTEQGPAITVIAAPPIVTVSLTRTGRVACGPEGCAARRYGRDRSLAGNPPLPGGRKVFACIDSDIAITAPT